MRTNLHWPGRRRRARLVVLLAAAFFLVLEPMHSQNPDRGARLNPPGKLTAAGGDHMITLRWRATTSIAEADYNVYQATNLHDLFWKIGATRTNSYTVSNLVNGTTYYFRVTASLNGAAESHASDTAKAIPGDKR